MTPTRKRRHSDSQIEYGPNKIVAIDASIQAISFVEQTDGIFKLNNDCYGEAFDYLSMKNLVSVARTCKQLREVAKYWFKINYPGHVSCNSMGVRVFDNKTFCNLTIPIPFIRSVSTDTNGLW